MLNITLNLTAAPELLNTLNKIAEAFTNAEIKAQAEKEYNIPQSAQQALPMQNTAQMPAQQPVSTTSTYQKSVQPPTPQRMPTTGVPVQPVQQPQSPVPQSPVPQPSTVPTEAQTYTMNQLALAGTQLIDSGHMKELQQLLATFGVQALTMLPKEQYGAFATQLRSLGAKI